MRSDASPRKRSGKAAHITARQILGQIVDNDLPVGARLPNEAALQKEFAVSRASLREALRILETYGIIGIRTGPGGGPYVRDTSATDFGDSTAVFLQRMGVTLEELVQAHMAVELMMARLAAATVPANPSCAPADRIRAAIERGFAAVDASAAEWQAAAIEFHAAVNSASASRILNLYAGALADVRNLCIGPPRIEGRELRRWAATKHQHIGEAILRGDARTAESETRVHLLDSAERLFSRFVSPAQRAF